VAQLHDRYMMMTVTANYSQTIPILLYPTKINLTDSNLEVWEPINDVTIRGSIFFKHDSRICTQLLYTKLEHEGYAQQNHKFYENFRNTCLRYSGSLPIHLT
jgi:hypothetical protein